MTVARLNQCPTDHWFREVSWFAFFWLFYTASNSFPSRLSRYQDNGIIAADFKRYGLADEANKVMLGIFDAISRFDSYRPPEVFADIHRKGDVDFPVLYPGGANIPQVWATGSVFHMVRTMLGLRADAPNKRLYVKPTLPNWVPELELQQLRAGPCSLTIRFWRDGTISRWEADKGTPKNDIIHVVDEPEE